MSHRSDVIFCYDGSFAGLLCCVFRCYEIKVSPAGIITSDTEQLMLGEYEYINTDDTKAQRVQTGIENKLGRRALDRIRRVFLSCDEQKDLIAARYIILGFRYGKAISGMLADDTVNAFFSLERAVGNEAHLYLGFVRFSEQNGIMTSVIEPKNSVVPIIAGHFIRRFGGMPFIIFDKTHKTAVISSGKEAEIIFIDDLHTDPPDSNELRYRSLWRTFYDTIGIKERYNPRCRMTHCPKRFWSHMTEFTDDTDTSAALTDGNTDTRRIENKSPEMS